MARHNDPEKLAAAACWRALASLDYDARRRVLAAIAATNDALRPTRDEPSADTSEADHA